MRKIFIELIAVSGDYFPICWNRLCFDNIEVSQVLKMLSYFLREAVMPHFPGHTRQRGNVGPFPM